MPLLLPDDEETRDASTRIALSVVVLNWNSADYLRAALASIVSQNWRHNIEVIVVDNASSMDDAVGMVRREFPQVELLALDKNLGFAAGNNAALHRARGDYLLFLNPDTVTHDGALDTLIDFMDAHPQAGACGPKLLNDDGKFAKKLSRVSVVWRGAFSQLVSGQNVSE